MESRHIETITNQIDLAPTLPSLMGIASKHSMVGRASEVSRPARYLSDTPEEKLPQKSVGSCAPAPETVSGTSLWGSLVSTSTI